MLSNFATFFYGLTIATHLSPNWFSQNLGHAFSSGENTNYKLTEIKIFLHFFSKNLFPVVFYQSQLL